VDPGAVLLSLAQERLDKLEIRTVGGGGALAGAIMRVMPTNDDQSFHFLGHLEERTTRRLLNRIKNTRPHRWWGLRASRPSYVLFTHGRPLKACWKKFCASTTHLKGEFYLIANLARDNEYTYRLPMNELSKFNATAVDDEDKIVIWLHP
jgi:16S rRNA C1402 (ribose-2'-O) methylase RsmI